MSEELRGSLTQIRILRLDTDSSLFKYAHNKILIRIVNSAGHPVL